MVYEVGRALDSGTMDPVQVGNNPDEWFESMAKDGTYVNHTFIEMAALILDSDIVVVPLHGTDSLPCHIIRAGLLSNGGRGKNCPIFLGYFEDDRHTAGHFQSLMPFEDSAILDMVKNDDGVDVAQLLQLPARSPVPEAEDSEEVSFTPSINSTEFQTPAPSNSGSSLHKPTDVSCTPPSPDTPFVYRRKVLLSLSDSPALESPVPDLTKKPSKKRARKRERTPSPLLSPIPVFRIGKNRENDEWMKLAAATRKSRRIRDQRNQGI